MTSSHYEVACRTLLDSGDFDAVLVTSPASVFYLSGFLASVYLRPVAVLFLREQLPQLFVPHIERPMADKLAWDGIVHDYIGDVGQATAAIGAVIEKAGIQYVGFEGEFMAAVMARGLTEIYGAQFVDITNAIQHLWWVKSQSAIALIQRAGWLCTAGFREASIAIAADQPEIVAKGRGDCAILDAAARHFPDNRIQLYSNVISGERVVAGGGHDLPYGRNPVKGDPVFHVWAVNCEGYWALLSRTTHMGEPSDEERRIQDLVETAKVAALKVVRPGLAGADVFQAAASVLRSEEIPQTSIYVGRGIGAKMGESPVLDAECRVLLEAGMVLRIGPEIFGPFGGFGSTETVLVTLGGYRILTDVDAEQHLTHDRVA